MPDTIDSKVMPSVSDQDLLLNYVHARSDAAFAELVNRYIDLVYSAALRQMRDAHLAEDCTQAVFLLLVKKAPSLSRNLSLAGWLHNAVRYVCANANRARNIRGRHEMKAAETLVASQTGSTSSIDPEMESRLDQALSRLRHAERDAILLRYFKGLSAREVGQSLKISEEAAQKRVSRGVEKLRRLLAPAGSPGLSTSAVVAVVSCSIGTAPRSVVAAILAAHHAPATVSLAKGALLMMTVSKVKVALVALILILIMATVVGVGVHYYLGGSQPSLIVAARSSPLLPATPPADLIDPAHIPADAVTGVVLDAKGYALRGVTVYLSTAAAPIRVFSPRQTQTATYRTTDTNGRFFFPANAKNRAVVVADNTGYCRATIAELASQPKLVLQPWARVEGTLYLGDKPMPNETVHLSRTRFGSSLEAKTYRAVYDERTQTDAAGHYVFDRVAPGDTWVSWFVSKPRRYDRQFVYVDVHSGDSLTVNVGGRGRPITGNIIYNGTDNPHFYGSVWPARPHAMSTPLTWLLMNQATQEAYTAAWQKTSDAKLFDQEECPIDFDVDADHTFTVPDLPAGQYVVVVTNWTAFPTAKGSIMLNVSQKVITIPEMPGGRMDEPLDVGSMTMLPVNRK